MKAGTKSSCWIVAAVSFCLLMLGIGNLRTEFGDEVYYHDATHAFLAGLSTTNSDHHPPLAKYFMAVSISALGDNPVGWRFPSVLAGTLLALAIFGMTYKLTGERRTAYVAWLLTIAGGFWYFMSRLANLSIYELAFEMTGIWVFLIAIESDGIAWWCASGVFFGLSVASRWLGVMGLVICIVVALQKRRLYQSCAMAMTALAAYFAAWIPLLIRAHMPLRYLIDANLFIFRFHHDPKGGWDTGEPWWTWLLRTEQARSFSPFMANPIVGALGLVALVLICAIPVKRRFALPVLLYIAHMLPWVLGIRPVTYYYYYFEAYTFLPIALAVVVANVTLRKIRLDVIVTTAALGYFVYWYPTWGFFPPPFGGVFGDH
jgi:dolichyl-phosphate-mannose--protein O-mannosyl transferase